MNPQHRRGEAYQMEALLQKIQQRIQYDSGSPQLECWLQNVGLTKETDGQLALICPNVFSKRWLEEKYRAPLEKVLQEEMGREVALTFRVGNSMTCTAPGGEASRQGKVNGRQPQVAQRLSSVGPAGDPVAEDKAAAPPPFLGWNPQFRFSTFVVGNSNRFAWTAVQEVCKESGSHYNPLLILATAGLGKTHLAHAAGDLLARQNPGMRVSYCTAEGFFNEIIQHARGKNIAVFKEKYRKSCDVFLFDDLQFVLGKTSLQSELCHTLDVLLNRGRRVILLGFLPSRDVSGLSDNLRSRIFSGLVVSMEPPEYEIRLEILNQFARTSGISFPDGTLPALARLVRSDVRDLEGAFKRLLALHSLLRHPVGPETLEAHFRDLSAVTQKLAGLEEIRRHVAQYFGLRPEDLSSRSRQNKVLYPRQVCMYLSRKHTYESLEAIGAVYKRDHSSVVYALRSLERKMSRTPRIDREVQFIEERLFERC
jgi:chromosomal replication initiator protein